MKKSTLLVAFLSAMALSAAWADMSTWREYFVSDSAGNDAWDGTAEEWAGEGSTVGPKKTIQAAVNLADGSGTIVTVAPGVYATGGRAVGGTYPFTNRVYIAQENVLLRSSGGKEVTHIVGARDTSPNGWNGLGTNAVRCVMGKNKNTVTVKGFTLRDGAAGYDFDSKKDSSTRGGGAKEITVVDCVVSNCTAHRGAAGHSSRFVRSIITQNANAGNSQFGDAGDASAYFSCLIVRNPGNGVVSYPSLMVNCTVAVNPSDVLNGVNDNTTHRFANCVFLNNENSSLNLVSSKGTSEILVYGCVADDNAKMLNADEATITNAVNNQYRTSVGFDWRLLSDADAVGRGKGEYLSFFTLPECEGGVYRDLNGNAIDPASDAIDCGAFQGNYVSAADLGSEVNVMSKGIYVDGYGKLGEGDWIVSGRFPEMFRLKSALPAPAYAFYNSAITDSTFKGFHFHYPDEDGWARYVAAPGREATNTLTMVSVAAELYVNPVNGSDANDGSRDAPFRTLQAANDAATVNYTLVHAAPGIYAEGGKQSTHSSGAAFSNRLCVTQRRIGFVADVPRSAVIVGAPDPATGGLGTNAMRCVAFTGTNPSYAYIRGFDLTGGYSHDDFSDHTFFYGGAVYCRARRDVQLVDCVISNNYGCNSLVYGGTTRRSKIFDNQLKNSAIFRDARVYDSVFAGNSVKSFVIGYNIEAAGCTADNNAKGLGLGHSTSGKVYLNGSVLANCKSAKLSDLSAEPRASVVQTDIPVTDFADFSARDYRLSACSPAVGLVTPEDFAAISNWYEYFGLDVNGCEPVFDAEGNFAAGASRAEPLPYVVLVAGEGAIVSGGVAGTNVLTSAEATFTIDASAVQRPFDGFVLNGERQEVAGTTWEIKAADLKSRDVFGINYTGTWYVDAAAADDSGDGFTPATAKRTLSAASANAIQGDVIKAAPGVYAEGTSKAAASHATANRVVLADGVTLESTHGREVTEIRGESATIEPDGEGNGTNAVRCVYLGRDAVLRGFTLTGGRTQYLEGKLKDYTLSDFCGGGVYGAGQTESRVEDCTIRDCSAHVGGAGMDVAFSGSTISNCTHSGGSGARSQISRNCNFYNCIIDHTTKANAVEVFTRIAGCTFGTNTKMPVLYQAYGDDYPHVADSVFLGSGSLYEWNALAVFTNCLFGAKVTYPAAEDGNYMTNGCMVAAAEEFKFDGYSPVIGENVCVDAAFATFGVPSAKDALGGQRQMNGAQDIGAVEASWLARYALDIGPGVKVLAADKDAKETDAKAVCLPATTAGSALVVRLAKAKVYEIEARLAEGATLVVTKGETIIATLTAAADAQKVKYVPRSAGEELVFAVSGPGGYAELIGCRHYAGSVISFR